MRTEVLGDGEPEYAVVACVHGYEDCGYKAIERFKNSDYQVKKPVKLIVANEKAKEQDERFVDDDLNRVFPGDYDADSHEKQLAPELLNEIDGLKVLDFHSTVSKPTPFAFFINERDIDLVESTGLDRAVDLSHLPETMMNYMRGISVECGYRKSDECYNTAYDIMINFLAAEGVIDEEYTVSNPDLYSINGKVEGAGYRFTGENFQKVEQGEIFARKEGEELKAQEDFIPLVMSTDGYEHMIGFKGKSISREDLETNTEDVVDLSKKLMSYETVSPVNESEIFDFVKNYLEDRGVEAEIHDISGVKSLTASIGNGDTSICFNGHLDVVETGGGWEVTDPFEPVVIDGKLYGRGATDMKAEAAAMINALVQLNSSPEFEGSLKLMLVGDEELGGENGTKPLVENEYRENGGFDHVVVGEPTDMNIQVATRGALWLDIYLEGENIHASRVDEAEKNTFTALSEALRILDDTEFDVDSGDLPDPSIAATTIETDETYNSLPGEVKIGLDIRYVPSQNVRDIEALIKERLEDVETDVRVERKVDHGGAYRLSDKDFEGTVHNEVENARGKAPKHITEGGTSDGRYFAEKGTDYVELGLNQEMVHREDEYCHVEKLRKLQKAYIGIAKNLAK